MSHHILLETDKYSCPNQNSGSLEWGEATWTAPLISILRTKKKQEQQEGKHFLSKRLWRRLKWKFAAFALTKHWQKRGGGGWGWARLVSLTSRYSVSTYYVYRPWLWWDCVRIPTVCIISLLEKAHKKKTRMHVTTLLVFIKLFLSMYQQLCSQIQLMGELFSSLKKKN